MKKIHEVIPKYSMEYLIDHQEINRWQLYLEKHGFVVLTNVLDEESIALGHKLFNNQYDAKTIETADAGTITDPTFTISEFAWYSRTRPSIIRAYQNLYETDQEMVCSFDRGNAHNGCVVGNGYYWLHVDYPLFNDRKIGGLYYQSFISFTTSRGFRIAKGTHTQMKLDQTRNHVIVGDASASAGTSNTNEVFYQIDQVFYQIDQQLTDQLVDVEQCVVNVLSPAGSLTIWNTKCIHDSNDSVPTRRLCVYLCYVPASWPTEEEIELRQELFKSGKTTFHWPVQYIGLHYDTTRDWNWKSMVKKYPKIKGTCCCEA